MTTILALTFGLYYLGVGIAFLLNPRRIANVYKEVLGNESFIYLGGVIALLLGAFVISIHNIWVAGFPVIITIIGWLSFLKGLTLLTCSNLSRYFTFMYEKSDLFYRSLGFVILLFGIFLIYHGL